MYEEQHRNPGCRVEHKKTCLIPHQVRFFFLLTVLRRWFWCCSIFVLFCDYRPQINIWAASWQNKQNGMCAQRRLRSAWASAQSDQSLRCPHEESLGPKLPIERTAKNIVRPVIWAYAQADLSLRWAHMLCCWFCHEAAHFHVNFGLPFIVITSLGKGADRSACCLPVCPRCCGFRFHILPLVAGSGLWSMIVAFHRDHIIVFFLASSSISLLRNSYCRQ